MTLRFRGTIVAVLVAAGAFAPSPAAATPEGTKVARVFQLPCQDSLCRAGQDRLIAASGFARGSIQVHISSSSSIGLEWVRLEARAGDAPWTCVKWWATADTSFSTSYDWDTTTWPGDCPNSSSNDTLTANGVYEIRVVAQEKALIGESSDTAVSAPFTVKINNRPVPPTWSAEPEVSGADQKDPRVELRWNASPEPDIVEYHYVRNSPDGEELEFAVSATNPGGQGCTINATTYVCVDDVFEPTGFGGKYEYLLIAYRSSPATSDSCAIPPVRGCVQSVTSKVRVASVIEPRPPEVKPIPPPVSSLRSGRVRPARVLGRQFSNRDFFTGSYEKTLPYEERRVLVPQSKGKAPVLAAGDPVGATGDFAEDGRTPWMPLATGLVMLLVAAHLGVALRRPPA